MRGNTLLIIGTIFSLDSRYGDLSKQMKGTKVSQSIFNVYFFTGLCYGIIYGITRYVIFVLGNVIHRKF